MTIATDEEWRVTDKPEWFLALPTSLDTDSVRDYVIIKGTFEQVPDSDPNSVTGPASSDPSASSSSSAPSPNTTYTFKQTAEYY